MQLSPTNIHAALLCEQDGKTLATGCMHCTFYFRYAPYDGLKDFIDRSREALGDLLSHLSWGARYTKITARTETKIQRMFENISFEKHPTHYFSMRSHNQDKGCSAARLTLVFNPKENWAVTEQDRELRRSRRMALEKTDIAFSPPISIVTATFPLDHPFAKPARFKDWVLGLKCVRDGSFVGGHAGYRLETYSEVYDSRHQKTMECHVAKLILNHPGLDYDGIPGLGVQLLCYRHGDYDMTAMMKRVQWLNFLRADTLQLAGNRDEICARLEADPLVKVLPVGDGLMVQAGRCPGIGNVSEGDMLPAYRAAAKILSAARFRHRRSGNTLSPLQTDWLEALDS